ncbi:MAG: tryptophan synthase subunit alpha [Gammaproteobacteria bacterium]|nr:tryptophan synthase subunit alpha [Gammaproteobacteria bacterium]
MTNRIEARFQMLAESRRTALIPFLTAGDPGPEMTLPLMHGLVKAGADLLELGVPFSDPMADGPVIQRASERALLQGMTLAKVLRLVAAFRSEDATTPVILMGYLNPIERMGYSVFARAAAAAGVDGVLTVDLPPEEGEEYLAAFDSVALDPIFLVSPTTTDSRLRLIDRVARGFLYYVSLKGVTGSATLDVDGVRARLSNIRKGSHVPTGVGFGVRDGKTAAQLAVAADAVVVGSALIERLESAIERGLSQDEAIGEVAALLEEMRLAMDQIEELSHELA